MPVFINALPSTNRKCHLDAILCQTVVIPPYSELETLSRVDGSVQGTGFWLVEDNLASYSRIKATVARAVVTPNPEIVTRIINPTKSTVTIHKGTRIATVSDFSHDGVLVASQLSDTPSVSDYKKQRLHELAYSLPQLSNIEKEKFYTLLISFSDVFPENDDDIGHTDVVQHHIDTGSSSPIRQPLRRIPIHKQP